jgi:hypothetical protein
MRLAALRRVAILVLLLIEPLCPTIAQDLSAPPPKGPERPADAQPELSSWLGLRVQEVFERLGPPAELFALRGQEAWQDDVVFYYPGGFSLFWYEGRVWQVRLDIRYTGELFRLRMGASRQQVRSTLGSPWREEEAALVYLLEDRGYPVRLRFYFEENLLVDVYCYRGDL